MIRWRWPLLCLAMTIYAIALPASQRLKLDRSLEAMFSRESAVRKNFEQLQRTFGVAELVVFAYRDPDLWASNGEGLERANRIRKRIESIDGISSTMDLSRIDEMLSRWEASLTPWKGLWGNGANHPLLDEKNLQAQKFKKLFEGQTHSASSDLVAVACLLDPTGQNPKNKTIESLRRIDVESDQPPMLVGQRVMIEEGFEAIETDGQRLGFFTSITLFLLLWLGFRSLRWSLVTLAVIHWSLVVTRCLLVWLSLELTMVSSMLASIVTVIAIATTMHWMLGYQRSLESGASAGKAMQESLVALRGPITWACITDAIGFASLLIAQAGPVQDYGFMMALASIVILAGIFLIVPGLVLLPVGSQYLETLLDGNRTYAFGNKTLGFWLNRWVHSLGTIALQRSKIVFLAGCLLACAGLVGCLFIEVQTDFIRNFRSDSPIVKAYEAIESELGGAGVWDIVIPLPAKMDPQHLERVEELESDLRSLQVGPVSAPVGFSHVMSIVDADAAFQNPLLRSTSFETRMLGMATVMGDFYRTLVSKQPDTDQRYLRIMLRSQEQVPSRNKLALIAATQERLQRFAIDFGLPTEGASDQSFVSGYYVLLSSLVSSVIEDQWRCLGLAIVGIWLALWIAIRNARLATIALLPNILPSLLVLGWFGWTKNPVNLGAAMIAAVSMGLSVDASLHYLTGFQRSIQRGDSKHGAIQRAQSEIGLPIVLATIALVLGFGSLSFSEFLPTVVFGVTAACSMLGGMVSNLLLLPALINLSYAKPSMRSMPTSEHH